MNNTESLVSNGAIVEFRQAEKYDVGSISCSLYLKSQRLWFGGGGNTMDEALSAAVTTAVCFIERRHNESE